MKRVGLWLGVLLLTVFAFSACGGGATGDGAQSDDNEVQDAEEEAQTPPALASFEQTAERHGDECIVFNADSLLGVYDFVYDFDDPAGKLWIRDLNFTSLVELARHDLDRPYKALNAEQVGGEYLYWCFKSSYAYAMDDLNALAHAQQALQDLTAAATSEEADEAVQREALSWEECVGYRRDMYEQKMYYGQLGFERGGELNTPEEWAWFLGRAEVSAPGLVQANYLALAVATHDRVYEAQAFKPSDPQWQELESHTQALWAKQSSKWQKHHPLKRAEQLEEAIRNKDTAPQDWPKNAVIDKELSAAALELLKGQEPTATRVAFPTGWFVSTSNGAEGYPTYRIIQVAAADVQRGEHRKGVWYRLRPDADGHGSYGHLYVCDGPNGEFFLD